MLYFSLKRYNSNCILFSNCLRLDIHSLISRFACSLSWLVHLKILVGFDTSVRRFGQSLKFEGLFQILRLDLVAPFIQFYQHQCFSALTCIMMKLIWPSLILLFNLIQPPPRHNPDSKLLPNNPLVLAPKTPGLELPQLGDFSCNTHKSDMGFDNRSTVRKFETGTSLQIHSDPLVRSSYPHLSLHQNSKKQPIHFILNLNTHAIVCIQWEVWDTGSCWNPYYQGRVPEMIYFSDLYHYGSSPTIVAFSTRICFHVYPMYIGSHLHNRMGLGKTYLCFIFMSWRRSFQAVNSANQDPCTLAGMLLTACYNGMCAFETLGA